MPLGILLGSSPPAAATPGPASGPRPASSQPATGQTPRLISARSRRKLGGAIAITPFGSLAAAFSDLSRIMPASCAGTIRLRNRELGGIPAIQPLYRHCERSEAIQLSQNKEAWIASSLRSSQ